MRRPRRRQRGFTLVETVVATILLAVGVAACLGAMAISTRTTGVANDYSTATLLADRRFSELTSDPTTITTGEQSGDFGSDYSGFTWTQSIDQTDITNLLRVQITIQWVDGQSTRSALFTTYVPQPQQTTS